MVWSRGPHVNWHRIIVTRAALRRLAVLSILSAIALGCCWWTMIRMPGKSWRGALPPPTDAQLELAEELRGYVDTLAGQIGERSVFMPERLAASQRWIETTLAEAGYEPQRQTFDARDVTCANIWVELPGTQHADEIIVVGGHYDSVDGCPAANDNASGVAATLAIARAMRGDRPARTIRFVLFVNEEPPFFQTAEMGSWVYAKGCRERDENIVAMLSLETIGYYTDAQGSQQYPGPFGLIYPSRGNFIAFVGNFASRKLVRRTVGAFRRHARFPSEGGALPGAIIGVGWSDHWAFWQEGYPALMVTDTAPFRYPHYHGSTDTPEKLDYQRMARVVEGVREVVRDLAGR